MGVYGALGVLQSVSILCAVIAVTIGTLRSSIKVRLSLNKLACFLFQLTNESILLSDMGL